MTDFNTPKPTSDETTAEAPQLDAAPAAEGAAVDAPQAEGEAAVPQLDEAQLAAFVSDLRANQNLPAGVVAGFVAAIVGGAVWAIVTLATDYQIGWLAIGVGALVGFAIRFAGKGIDSVFGYVGAVLALLGCLGGNVAIVYVMIRNYFAAEGITDPITPTIIYEGMIEFSELIDLLFYGLAIYSGYTISFRKISDDEFAQLAQTTPTDAA